MTAREFSFPDFERITPDLTGTERLGVFLGLPVDLQNEAWRELGERIEAQSIGLFAESRLVTGYTPEEFADEVALIWEECRKVPLGAVDASTDTEAADTPRTHGTRRHRSRLDLRTDLELLRTIPSREFVPLLAGREANRAGFVQCPFHGGGDERTPSLHVGDDQRWYCHSCQQGGGIVDFYALIIGREVPAGAEFAAFVRELAIQLEQGGM